MLAKISILIQIEIKSQNLKESQRETSALHTPSTRAIEGTNRCQSNYIDGNAPFISNKTRHLNKPLGLGRRMSCNRIYSDIHCCLRFPVRVYRMCKLTVGFSG